jgi:hypothetical protein
VAFARSCRSHHSDLPVSNAPYLGNELAWLPILKGAVRSAQFGIWGCPEFKSATFIYAGAFS